MRSQVRRRRGRFDGQGGRFRSADRDVGRNDSVPFEQVEANTFDNEFVLEGRRAARTTSPPSGKAKYARTLSDISIRRNRRGVDARILFLFYPLRLFYLSDAITFQDDKIRAVEHKGELAHVFFVIEYCYDLRVPLART